MGADQEKKKKSNFFSRLMGHREKTAEAEPDSAKTKDAAAGDAQEASANPKSDGGVISVPANSQLMSLWTEWKFGTDLKDQEVFPMDLTLAPADIDEFPLDVSEIHAEKPHILGLLMTAAAQRTALVHPKPTKSSSSENGGEEEAPAPPSSDIDADISIFVAKKRMAAWAVLFPPSGNGGQLQRQQIELALQEASVCNGIIESALDHLADDTPYFELVPVAFGTHMIPGEPGSVTENFQRDPQKTFEVDKQGKMDYRIQHYVQLIAQDDVICELIPPTSGTSGMDVLGNEIPAKPGQPEKLVPGESTVISEDGTKLIAAMDGHVLYYNGRFNVKPIFYVDGDVDFHVGNIDFVGDVYITGNVREDFQINAAGTVTVEGLVEGASIEAGGDIYVTDGIPGDSKAVIKAAGIIKAGYIESATVFAGTYVEAGSIISSMIYSGGEINVCGGRGTIIGGKLIAAKEIRANTVGCRAERLTTLVVGHEPYIELQQEETAQTLFQAEKESKDLELNLKFLKNSAGEDPQKMQIAEKMEARHSLLSMQIIQLRRQLDEFASQQLDTSECRIIIDSAYPLIDINIQKFSHRIEEKGSGYNIHIENDLLLLV